MAERPDGDKDRCLDISLQSVASHLRTGDGREIPFAKVLLTIRNVCDTELSGVVPHATLGQEGGTVQDVSESLAHSAGVSIPPGGTLSWDVYDIILPAHPGTASKVHMFGYRAALNWRFELTAWAEYHRLDSPVLSRTPISRWELRWSVADSSAGDVGLGIGDLKD